MAAKKNTTTSSFGLFSSLEGGDDSFNAMSGPKLFTPIPLNQPDTSQVPLSNAVIRPDNTQQQSFPTYGMSSAPSQIQSPYQPQQTYHANQLSTLQQQPPLIPMYTMGMTTSGADQLLTGPMLHTPVRSSAISHSPMGSNSTHPGQYSIQGQTQINQSHFPSSPSVQIGNDTPQSVLKSPQSQAIATPQRSDQLPPMYNISPFPKNGPSLSQARESPLDKSTTVSPVTPHWFYHSQSVGWLPFSFLDSNNLESAFTNQTLSQQLSTDGGRYDVDLLKMMKTAVYWNEMPCEVRRCTWFYKADGETKFTPYECSTAEKLEKEYIDMMSKGIFNIRIDLGPGKFVIFHNPNVLIQYKSTTEHDWTGEDSKARPQIVKRGTVEWQQEFERGEHGAVDQLVFVVHGIGPVADLRMRSIVECVDDLRRNALNLSYTHQFTMNGENASRVEFLPIQWYSCLRDDRFGIDKQLKSLSLPSISKLRNFTNETLTDILFFTSPMYCQTICDKVADEMNRMYSLFKTRNPSYTGRVSVVGHSLGSCILFDILANQNNTAHVYQEEINHEDFGEKVEDIVEPTNVVPPVISSDSKLTLNESPPPIHVLLSKLNLIKLEDLFNEQEIDTETLLMCSEGDLRDLGVPFGPTKKLISYIKGLSTPQSPSPIGTSTPSATSPRTVCKTRGTQTRLSKRNYSEDGQCAYLKSLTGTGQPLVVYPDLNFQVDSLFCLGSPIGLFLTCRGVTSIGPDFRLPKCPKFLNIFHPYDPVVYRLEPLINQTIDIPPVLIPHHKGRKRFHLEIKENLSRVSANLKSGLIDAVNRTWSSINDFARAHRSIDEKQSENDSRKEDVQSSSSGSADVTTESIDETLYDFGKLNQGRRVDYVLQEKPFEILNEYLFALSSHTCYWTSEDTALLMLREVYTEQK